MKQIILQNLRRPKQKDINEDTRWLADSFGFSTGRDTEQMTNQILQNVLNEVAVEGSASTEHIATELGISAQRVNYHIRLLVDSGFLYRERKLIFLRQGSVKAAVEEMRRDANRIFDNISRIAEEIDVALNFKNRR